jgi:chromosome segregation ATPase
MSGITGAQDAEGNQIDFKSDIDATRTYNTEGYDAALRDYTMSKDEYDKAVADLNSQTESLQQEDKVLELRLNQIDTEQSELQTELDAVKAVLDKNIENTFNTFS